MNRSSRRLAATSLLAGAIALAPTVTATAAQPDRAAVDHGRHAAGAVYALSNQLDANAVVAWSRGADGTLRAQGSYPTGGTGTAAGLGSQNSVVVDETGRYVFAVNAGSDTITSFAVVPQGLRRLSVVSSGGDMPVSIAVHDDLAYVVNAGGGGNVSGFTVRSGRLTPLYNSTAPLSATGSAPAQVSFTPDGHSLVVSEKETQVIDVYSLDRRGAPARVYTAASVGATPFGFDFTPSGRLLVSEAGPSAASSYGVGAARLKVVSSSVGNTQAAACWLVVSEDGRFAFTGNGGGSNSISSYRVGRRGELTLQDARAAGTAAGVSDIAFSGSGDFLYGRLGDGTVAGFELRKNGSLVPLPVVGGLPAGAVGIAAF